MDISRLGSASVDLGNMRSSASDPQLGADDILRRNPPAPNVSTLYAWNTQTSQPLSGGQQQPSQPQPHTRQAQKLPKVKVGGGGSKPRASGAVTQATLTGQAATKMSDGTWQYMGRLDNTFETPQGRKGGRELEERFDAALRVLGGDAVRTSPGFAIYQGDFQMIEGRVDEELSQLRALEKLARQQGASAAAASAGAGRSGNNSNSNNQPQQQPDVDVGAGRAEDMDAATLGTRIGLTNQVWERVKFLMSQCAYEHKWSDLVCSDLGEQVSLTCVEHGRVLRKVRLQFAAVIDRVTRLNIETLRSLNELLGLHEELAETHATAKQIWRKKESEMGATLKAALTDQARQFEQERENDRQAVAESNNQVDRMNDTLRTLNGLFRNLQNDMNIDAVAAADFRQRLSKAEETTKELQAEVDSYRDMKAEFKAAKEKVALLEQQLAREKSVRVRTQEELARRESVLAEMMEKEAQRQAEMEKLARMAAEERQIEDEIEEAPSSVLCVKCKKSLDDMANIRAALLGEGNEGPKKVACHAFRLLLPNLRGEKPPRSTGWLRLCQRSMLLSKIFADAFVGEISPRRPRFAEFVYSFFSREAASEHVDLRERAKLGRQSDLDRWGFYYATKMLSKESAECKLFFQLLDGSNGEDYETFALYCLAMARRLQGAAFAEQTKVAANSPTLEQLEYNLAKDHESRAILEGTPVAEIAQQKLKEHDNRRRHKAAAEKKDENKNTEDDEDAGAAADASGGEQQSRASAADEVPANVATPEETAVLLDSSAVVIDSNSMLFGNVPDVIWIHKSIAIQATELILSKAPEKQRKDVFDAIEGLSRDCAGRIAPLTSDVQDLAEEQKRQEELDRKKEQEVLKPRELVRFESLLKLSTQEEDDDDVASGTNTARQDGEEGAGDEAKEGKALDPIAAAAAEAKASGEADADKSAEQKQDNGDGDDADAASEPTVIDSLCIDIFMWIRAMMNVYQDEQANRKAAIKLMFETAASGALTTYRPQTTEDADNGDGEEKGGATSGADNGKGSSSNHGPDGGNGNSGGGPNVPAPSGNGAGGALTVEEGCTVDFPQFEAIVRTLHPAVSVETTAEMFVDAYMFGELERAAGLDAQSASSTVVSGAGGGGGGGGGEGDGLPVRGVTCEAFLHVAEEHQLFSKLLTLPAYIVVSPRLDLTPSVRSQIGAMVHYHATLMTPVLESIEDSVPEVSRKQLRAVVQDVHRTLDQSRVSAFQIDGVRPLAAYRRLLNLALKLRMLQHEIMPDQDRVVQGKRAVQHVAMELDHLEGLVQDFHLDSRIEAFSNIRKILATVRTQRAWRERLQAEVGPPISVLQVMRPGYLRGRRDIRSRRVYRHPNWVQAVIENVYVNKLMEDARSASLGLPKRKFTQIVVATFLTRWGVVELAERALHDFFYNVRCTMHRLSRVKLFAAFSGTTPQREDEAWRTEDALAFYLGVTQLVRKFCKREPRLYMAGDQHSLFPVTVSIEEDDSDLMSRIDSWRERRNDLLDLTEKIFAMRDSYDVQEAESFAAKVIADVKNLPADDFNSIDVDDYLLVVMKHWKTMVIKSAMHVNSHLPQPQPKYLVASAAAAAKAKMRAAEAAKAEADAKEGETSTAIASISKHWASGDPNMTVDIDGPLSNMDVYRRGADHSKFMVLPLVEESDEKYLDRRGFSDAILGLADVRGVIPGNYVRAQFTRRALWGLCAVRRGLAASTLGGGLGGAAGAGAGGGDSDRHGRLGASALAGSKTDSESPVGDIGSPVPNGGLDDGAMGLVPFRPSAFLLKRQLTVAWMAYDRPIRMFLSTAVDSVSSDELNIRHYHSTRTATDTEETNPEEDMEDELTTLRNRQTTLLETSNLFKKVERGMKRLQELDTETADGDEFYEKVTEIWANFTSLLMRVDLLKVEDHFPQDSHKKGKRK